MKRTLIENEKFKKNLKDILIIISIALVLVIAITVIIIFARKEKKAVSTETFEQIMTRDGYNVIDETHKYNSNESFVITNAYLAKGSVINIRYIKLSDDKYATSFFNVYKNSFEEQKEKSKVIEENEKEGLVYSLITAKYCIVIERLGDTVIFVNGNTKNLEDIEKVLDDVTQ